MKKYFLFIALKIVESKDQNDFRQLVFKELSKQKKIVSLLNFIYNCLPDFVKIIIIFSYGLFRSFFIPRKLPNSDAVGIFCYENEKRRLTYFKNHLSPLDMTLVQIKLRLSLWLFPLTRLFQILRILKLIAKKNQMLVSLRMSETIFYFLKLSSINIDHIKLFVTSSDSNPYAMSLMAISKIKDIKTCYLNHGHIPAGPPRLFFDINLLDGKSLEDVYNHSKGIMGETFHIGIEGEKGDLSQGVQNLDVKDKISLGVFLSILTNWDELFNFIKKISQINYIEKIIVRLHPNLILRDSSNVRKLESITNQKIEISYAKSIAVNDLKKCDLLIAGNSSVHLTSLRFGVPSIVLERIDFIPTDFYDFIKLGLAPLLEDYHDIDIKKVVSFYKNQDQSIIRYFDATYDMDRASNDSQIKEKIKTLIQS